MAKNINAILKKKSWTGKEVGKIVVASIIHEAKHKNVPHKQLLTQEEANTLTSSLKDDEWKYYSTYLAIYSSIIETHNMAQAMIQQYQSGFHRYLTALKEAYGSDKALGQMYDYPLILTQEKYDSLKAQATEMLRSKKQSFSSVVLDLAEYFLTTLPIAPKEIAEAIEDTKSEAVTNQRILDNYNPDLGRGYYLYKDGSRSDELTEEEQMERSFGYWRDMILMDKMETVLDLHELFYTGIDGIKEKYEALTGEVLTDYMAQDVLNYIDDILHDTSDKGIGEGIYKLSQLLEAGDFPANREWNFYDDPPEDITKFDILEDLMDRYRGIYANRYDKANNAEVEEISEQDRFKEFIADYPKLFKALKDYIEEKVPAFKGIKPAQYCKPKISSGELADLGIEEYVTGTKATDVEMYMVLENEDYKIKERAFRKGFAIIQSPEDVPLDDQGYMKDGRNLYHYFTSIDLLNSSQDMKDELYRNRYISAEPSLRYMYAYNTLLDIIASAYDIEDMDYLKTPEKMQEENIGNFNFLLYMFYANVCGDSSDKDRKRKAIKEVFEPFNIDDYKPTQEAIEKVTAKVNGLGFTPEAKPVLKHFDALIRELQER